MGALTALQRAIVSMVVATGVGAAAPVFAAESQPKFPSRPVRIVVGFSPGSATDITARLISPKLSDMWGQPVIIENRAGAGSTLANALVAQAAPDGYTLLMVSTAFAITAVLQKKLPYDPVKDFRGVTQIGASAGALMVPPSLGVKSVKQFIAYALERPGKLFFGSAGAGSGLHMSTERFNMLVGIKAVHVPFRGQPEMMVDLVAGRIHYAFPGLGPAMPFIKEGRLIPLAVNISKRAVALPDVPTMLEILPGFERDSSHALLAPARTPTSIVTQISKDVARVLDMPDLKERMQAIAFEPAPTTPEEYDRIIRGHLETFAKIAKSAGLIAND